MGSIQMKLLIPTFILFAFILAATTSSAQLATADWDHLSTTDHTAFGPTHDDVILADVYKDYYASVSGLAADGTRHGISVGPEFLRPLALAQQLMVGWNASGIHLVDGAGDYIKTYGHLMGRTIIELGTGIPVVTDLTGAQTDAFRDPANHTSNGAAEGTEFNYNYYSLRLTGYATTLEIYVVLYDSNTNVVGEVRVNNMRGYQGSTSLFENIEVMLYLLAAVDAAGTPKTGTYVIGDSNSILLNVGLTLDDMFPLGVTQHFTEESPTTELTAAEKADLNEDGIIGGPDFTLFAMAFKQCTNIPVQECDVSLE